MDEKKSCHDMVAINFAYHDSYSYYNFSVTLHSYRYTTTIYACIVGATSQSVQGITAHTQIQQQIMGNTDSKQCTFYIPCVYKLCIDI